MSDILHITVDDRERNEDLLSVLRRMETLELTISRLEVGDFLIDHSVVVERKTAADFAASLLDGRLFSQASKLVQSPFRPVYIIEGRAEDWQSLRVKRPAIQGALISLMLIFDIPVLRSNHAGETGHLLHYAGQQLMRARNGNCGPVRQIKAKRSSTRQRRVLQSLPGIGPDRARRLLEHFGSVRSCMAADEDALASIPGIGQVTARKIIETVEEAPAQWFGRTRTTIANA
jgi:DNA excision repair protein ERCC-4